MGLGTPALQYSEQVTWVEPDCFTYGLLLDYLCKNGRCSEAKFFSDYD